MKIELQYPFNELYKAGYTSGIKNVHYNGVLLNEEDRNKVFEKLFKEE